MSSTMNKRGKASRRSGARAGIGVHGEETVEFLFRIGGGTLGDLAKLMGLGFWTMMRTLNRLEAHEYVATTHDYARYKERKELTGEKERGRPPEFYYLTPRGVAFGGALAGAESDNESRKAYQRYNLPALSTHNSLENRLLLSVRGAAARGPGWEVFLSEVACESGLDYPLETGGKQGSRSRELEPDGEIPAATPHGRCVYMFEVESDLRTRTLVRKIEDYASWFRKAERVRPVLFVALSPKQARSMRRAAMDGLAASAGEWRKWAELFDRKARGRDAAERVSPHHLVGFAALQDVESAYSSQGIEAAVWTVMDEDHGAPMTISLSDMALLASEAREMVYGVKEVS